MTSSAIDDPAVVPPEVAAFAAAVRAALDDLDAEERDDLTDGLEAELLDRLADSGEESLGDPVAYAEELRTAAGLPARGRRLGFAAGLARAVAFLREDSAGWAERHPRLAGVAAFLAALRPAWWVLRAVVAYQVGALLLGGGELFLLPVEWGKLFVLALIVIVSVQFGRGRWLPAAWRSTGWLRTGAVLGNAALVVALIPVAASGVHVLNSNYWTTQYSYESEMYPSVGYGEFAVTTDGTPIENLFVYDADGQPVRGAQLYDQEGRPVNLVGLSDQEYVFAPDGSRLLVPSDATPGRAGWNVYPLDTVGTNVLGSDGIDPRARRVEADFPFPSVPGLVGAGAEADGAGTDAVEASAEPDAADPDAPGTGVPGSDD